MQANNLHVLIIMHEYNLYNLQLGFPNYVGPNYNKEELNHIVCDAQENVYTVSASVAHILHRRCSTTVWPLQHSQVLILGAWVALCAKMPRFCHGMACALPFVA